jgi:uncharacterized protein (TIGR00369 family)
MDPRLEQYEKFGDSDPFEDHAGPFYRRLLPSGEIICAFVAEKQHSNNSGAVHGGMLMTFADYALFALADMGLYNPMVTISFNAEFTAPALVGDFVEARGEIVRRTKSMIFVRGQVFVRGEPEERLVLNFSGIIKRVREKA